MQYVKIKNIKKLNTYVYIIIKYILSNLTNFKRHKKYFLNISFIQNF